MHLYIIRHGKAEQSAPTGRDRDRELADRGRRQARWLGERLASSEHPPTAIIASPFARADQTARLINESVGVDLRYDDRLIVDEPASGVMDLIAEQPTGASVALVGHNPQLERLTGMLAKQPRFEMKTGMCAVFGVDDSENPAGSARLIEVLRLD